MRLWQWLFLGGAATLGVYLFSTRKTCGHCRELARSGEFDELASFDQVCPQCVDEGITHSLPALERKMDACEADPTPECQEELSYYWHNLFLAAKKANKHREVGQNLINLLSTSNPTLERYASSGYPL